MTSPAPVYAATTPPRTVAYISVPYFRDQGRRGVQTDALAPRGTASDNDAALYRYIMQGTSWVDDHLNLGGQSLAAQQIVITGRARIGSDGYVTIAAPIRPVIGVVGASFGAPGNLTALTSLQGTDVQPTQIRVPVAPFSAVTWSGPIQLGVSAVGAEVSYALTIIAGYVVTTLTASASAGDLLLNVADTTGILPGLTRLTVYSGRTQFSFLAGAVSAASGPGTVACPAVPLAIPNDSVYPFNVSSLPESIMNATVLATRGIIKQPGGGNISANTRQKGSSDGGAADDFEQAWEIIRHHMVLTP